jgi:hypothetical protein
VEGSYRGLIFRKYPGICLGGNEENTKDISQYSRPPGRDLSLRPHENEAYTNMISVLYERRDAQTTT